MYIYSKPSATTKQKLVKLCQEKEQAGYECIKPIHHVYKDHKTFHNDRYGRFIYNDTDGTGYYQAIYRRVK